MKKRRFYQGNIILYSPVKHPLNKEFQAMVLMPGVMLAFIPQLSEDVLNHEAIHVRQMWELGVVFFYLWYGIEYLYHRWVGKTHLAAYKAISFEREAFANQLNFDYLGNKKWWSFWPYMGK